MEDSRGIERIHQAPVDLHERSRQRLEYPDRLVAAAEERRMAAEALRGRADVHRIEVPAHPSQSPAPLDELRVRGGDGRRGPRAADAPQRAVRGKERQAMLAQLRPIV